MVALEIAPSVWFPVVTLIVGAFLAAIFEAARDRRLAKREARARWEQRSDSVRIRRVDFQRATLLSLQDTAARLARFTAQGNHFDIMASRQTGDWKKQLLPPDVDEGSRKETVELNLLRVRARDEKIRVLAETFERACRKSMFAPNESESNKALIEMSERIEALQERIGEILRTLDDDEDKLTAQ